MDNDEVRFVVGGLAIAFGIYQLLFYRRAATRSSEFHQQLEGRAPWLYRLFRFRVHLSQNQWKPLSILGGLGLIVVGIVFLVVAPR